MLKINEFNLTLFFRTECNKNATTTIRNTQRHQPISESNARHYMHGRCVYTDATVLTSQRTSHTFVHTRIEHNAQCIKSAYKKTTENAASRYKCKKATYWCERDVKQKAKQKKIHCRKKPLTLFLYPIEIFNLFIFLIQEKKKNY